MNTMKDTQKKNVILALFMGYNVRWVDDTSTYGKPSYPLFNKDGITTDGVWYSTSYDDLMKVVDKIESLGYVVSIHRRGIQIWKYDPKISRPPATDLIIDDDFLDDYVGKDKFESLYECAVSFVEYYNDLQKKQNGQEPAN